MFGVDSSAGVTEVLADGSGNGIAIERNLFLLPALPGHGSPPSPQPGRVLAELVRNLHTRQERFAVVDLPPVGEAGAAVRTCSSLDVVMLVIEAEKTTIEMARRACRRLLDAGAPRVGIVLNKRRFYVPRWLHGEL
jgi:Mrp family chromosome partitioning ATPase